MRSLMGMERILQEVVEKSCGMERNLQEEDEKSCGDGEESSGGR
jgi:hypothetical protein